MPEYVTEQPDPVAVERTYQRYILNNSSSQNITVSALLFDLQTRRRYLDVLIAMLEAERPTQ